MIPVNEPLLDGNEAKYVADCVETAWISSAGAYIERFEADWAAYCGVKHGIAVSNGTTALQVAVACLGLESGDEVLMPTFTIISCAMPVVLEGAVPVLVDSDPVTWGMDVNQLADKITPRTKAIMPVHIYGHPVDMDPIVELAEKHGLLILEDAAEVHGAEYKGRKCGSFGDLSTFSFYANKIVTTGEGGMVLANDDELADKARRMRNLSFIPPRRFLHEEIGFNYRLTNIQAAIGVAQIERIEALVERKRQMGAAYNERLGDIGVIQLHTEQAWAKHVYWMYGLLLDESSGMDAEAFAQALEARGVQTRPFFLGMHEQPAFHKRGLFKGESYPVAERLARQGLYLPSGMALTMEQIDGVCEVVRDVLGA